MTVPAAQMDNIKAEAITIEERSPFQVVMMRFVKHRLAMVSMAVMTLIFIVTILAPYITTFKVDELNVNDYFVPFGTVDEATGRVHYLGTDNIGRDYFSRLLYAGRISLSGFVVSTDFRNDRYSGWRSIWFLWRLDRFNLDAFCRVYVDHPDPAVAVDHFFHASTE